MASERAARDEHLRGINDSEMEVVLRPGRPKPELLAGSELTVLRSLAGRNGDVVAGVPGIVDLPNQEQASVAQLLIDLDRESMARHGLTPAAMARAVEALFQGVVVGEIVEDGIPSRVVVRFPERLRSSPEDLAALPVTTPQGRLLRLDEVASIRSDLGPGIIRRENVGRVALLTANVAGSDLAGTVEAARDAVAAAIELPAGYTVTFSGQFEEAIRSERHQDRGGPDPGADVRPVAGAAGRS